MPHVSKNYQTVLRSLRDSEKFNRASWPAQSMYLRLLLSVDDYGRFYASPGRLLGQLFSAMLDQDEPPSRELIVSCLEELELVGLVATYSDSGERYLELVEFFTYQRPDRKLPPGRFPEPGGAAGNHVEPNGSQVEPNGTHGVPAEPSRVRARADGDGDAVGDGDGDREKPRRPPPHLSRDDAWAVVLEASPAYAPHADAWRDWWAAAVAEKRAPRSTRRTWERRAQDWGELGPDKFGFLLAAAERGGWREPKWGYVAADWEKSGRALLGDSGAGAAHEWNRCAEDPIAAERRRRAEGAA